ncbi:MAG: GtrA family protein [Eubacteriales bacterium]
MIDKVKVLYKKYRELIVYVFFGGLTTLVDFGVYMFLTDILFIDIVTANIIAWAAAVLFAFAVNKTIVFNDKRATLKIVLAQFVSFTGMRAVSGGLSTFFLWLFSELYGFNDVAVKAFIAAAVIVLNYIFSKLFIFKKAKSK